jgi:hypothetical protein
MARAGCRQSHAAALRAAARADPEGARHLNLSPHFTLEELTRSDTAVRLGIDNAAPQDVLPHLLVLAQGLEDVRLLLGNAVHVLSGYRCEDLERVLCAKDFAAWCSSPATPGMKSPGANTSRRRLTRAVTPATSWCQASGAGSGRARAEGLGHRIRPDHPRGQLGSRLFRSLACVARCSPPRSTAGTPTYTNGVA